VKLFESVRNVPLELLPLGRDETFPIVKTFDLATQPHFYVPLALDN
jgi:hypothetical protein